MALANSQMLEAKARAKAAEAAEEARLVQLMMDKFARDEADERAGAARRAANRAKYQEEIGAQKAARAEAYARERDAELAGVADNKEEEEYRLAVVAEARRRLLEEHARRLQGFLPKGALANQGEATIFRDAAGPGMGQTFGQTFGGTQRQQEGY